MLIRIPALIKNFRNATINGQVGSFEFATLKNLVELSADKQRKIPEASNISLNNAET